LGSGPSRLEGKSPAPQSLIEELSSFEK
jgi:hypothetical protein